MFDANLLEFDRRPSVVAFMARAFHPSPGLGSPPRFPALRARWRGHRVDPEHLAGFRALTGLTAERGLPLLYPHVLGFRLHMVLLTHPRFPVPIWRVLQVRNHLRQVRPVDRGESLDFETAVGDWRVVGKGIEVDLDTVVIASGEVVWSSLVTFYVRGRHGAATAASPLAAPPAVDSGDDAVLADFRLPAGPGWRFAGLTGDYNGIHWSDAYARRFGFPSAFHHPPLVLGRCLAALQRRAPELAGEGAQRLDAWLKGPVHYDVDAHLRGVVGAAETRFALHAGADQRPAVIGRLRVGEVATVIEDVAPARAGDPSEEEP